MFNFLQKWSPCFLTNLQQNTAMKRQSFKNVVTRLNTTIHLFNEAPNVWKRKIATHQKGNRKNESFNFNVSFSLLSIIVDQTLD